MALAIGLSVGTLSLALAGLAARSVPPTTAWWLQPIALLLPVLALVSGTMGVAWLVGALRSGHGLAGWMAVLLLMVAGVVFWRLFGGLERGREETGPAFRVMTLNSAWSRRGHADEIGRRFSEVEPHVIALQEISIRPGPEEGQWVAQGAGLALLEDSTYALTTLDRPPDPSRWMTNGTALFSRVPAGLSDPVLLDTTSTTHSGKYTRTEVQWEGQMVAIYNVHFRSFAAPRPSRVNVRLSEWIAALQASKNDFTAREAEARTLRRALESEPLPFIIAGDFNATPDHWSYAHVANGLVDALNAVPGLAWTYPDTRPLVRIDAVLASSHWAVRRAAVLPPGVSDHRPVLAELDLTR
ncbi:MAG: endonuclease/exonuclease/phosphatase family protein [Rubricoccaceae bacterium]